MAVADVNEQFATDTARRFGYARAETSWQAVAEADDVDVVSVVVANHLHREVVEGLLAAGKHVLCEKPFAPTVADAEAMVAAAAARPDLHNGVGFTFRRSPGGRRRQGPRGRRRAGPADPFQRSLLVRLRGRPRTPDELALQGRSGLGRPRRHRQSPGRPGRVPLRADRVGPRDDVRDVRRGAALPLRVAVGHAAAELSDVREPVENEDLVTFTATFASGATATMSASRAALGLANALGFELFGENAAATFDLRRAGEFGYIDRAVPARRNGYRQVVVGPEHPYLTGGLPMDFPGVGYGQNDLFVFQARAFLEQVAGLDRLRRSPTFGHGLHNLQLLAAVTESAATAAPR